MFSSAEQRGEAMKNFWTVGISFGCRITVLETTQICFGFYDRFTKVDASE